MNSITPVTRALLIANICGFVLQWAVGSQLLYSFALWPPGDGLYAPGFQPWQLITYAFLHGDFTHLLFNMLALYMFGSEVERLLGARRYLVYYTACVIGAALTQLALAWFGDGDAQPTIGASGGVFGLLLAYGLAFPHRKLMLLFPPIPMPAWLFVTLYGVLELVLGVTRTQDGVAHFAHLGGMAAGFVLILYWRRNPRGGAGKLR
jgi:membrane associated rhomboid family serine protease